MNVIQLLFASEKTDMGPVRVSVVDNAPLQGGSKQLELAAVKILAKKRNCMQQALSASK